MHDQRQLYHRLGQIIVETGMADSDNKYHLHDRAGCVLGTRSPKH
jgi:hypothetical protein